MSKMSSLYHALTGEQALFGTYRFKCSYCGQIDTVKNWTKEHTCSNTKCGKEMKYNNGFLIMCANPECCQAEHVTDFTKMPACSVCGSRKGDIKPISKPKSSHQAESQSRTQSHNNTSDTLQIPFEELKIGATIGEGANGVVSVAEWKGEKCAVKRFKCPFVSDNNNNESLRASVIKEAKVLKGLNHESIVCLKGVTTDPSTDNVLGMMLVMEYMEDGSLEGLIRSGAQLSRVIIIQILLDVAEGLIHLHSRNVIHRDIKSGNILLWKNRTRAKVSDFGTAKIYDTISGSVTRGVGTMGFMAPEVVEGKQYDESADIYSFGVVAYHMLTRSILAIIFDEKERIDKIKTAVADNDFCQLIVDCCRSDPKQRPSILKLAALLRRIQVH